MRAHLAPFQKPFSNRIRDASQREQEKLETNRQNKERARSIK